MELHGEGSGATAAPVPTAEDTGEAIARGDRLEPPVQTNIWAADTFAPPSIWSLSLLILSIVKSANLLKEMKKYIFIWNWGPMTK